MLNSAYNCRLGYSKAPLSFVFRSPLSDDFHLGVGVHRNNVVALRRLNSGHGVGLTVQIVLDKEVAPLLEVDAAVVTHEAIGMVQLVSGLDDCADNATAAACALGQLLKT